MATFESDVAFRARTHNGTNDALLLALPAELLQQILGCLQPVDLSRVARTCRYLAIQSYDDQIWQPIVNSYLPQPVSSPGQSGSFRELYAAHHPNWFLPKGRIWFGDSLPSGKLLLARYVEESGQIEAHTLTATRGMHSVSLWEKDTEVVIHSFEPEVSLDRNRAVIKLDLNRSNANDSSATTSSETGSSCESKYGEEILMSTFGESGLYSAFMLCRPLAESAISESTQVWPPQRFPALSRTRNESSRGFSQTGHLPSCYDEISQHNFRIRKWVEYNGRRSTQGSFSATNGITAALGIGMQYFIPGRAPMHGMPIRNPENITTYATLPESCYTPTAQKPWQGIWVGDYSAHGCEFLLITQPDKEHERPLPSGLDWLREWFAGGRRGSDSTNSSFSSAMEDQDELFTEEYAQGTETILDAPSSSGKHPDDYENVPTGRMEAIKLTGDPNIPRGEYTFIAPDIGHGGFVRVADEAAFRGARVVRSAGHIARRGFREDEYTPSQLMLLSHDRLAQYWEETGHISYFQRVDLNLLSKYR